MRFFVYISLLISLLACGCSLQSGRGSDEDDDASRTTTKATGSSISPQEQETWLGVYSSPAEIAGFTGTVLIIEEDSDKTLGYRKSFYNDISPTNIIHQELRRGGCLTEGNCIYIPNANGLYHDGKPKLYASIDRYTKVVVNGYITLMRDDAYNAFIKENKLYDYGILIRVASIVDPFLDLDEVEHKSIKELYDDKKKTWNDPFVHGPNER